MDKPSKDSHLRLAKRNVEKTRECLVEEQKRVQVLIDAGGGGAKVEDKWTAEYVKALNKERFTQLEKLHDSPYFSKCNCTIDGVTKDYYFGKFSFTENNIYSWVAPVASIRFDPPGSISYPLPTGKNRSGIMHEKDEYQIVDGKILFFSTESEKEERQLIHQEYFSTKKSGFLLPEIVSKMEKVQDTIIRAHYKNPFVVSGPAGSGKTTLALHRIAYLMQAPASTEIYKNSSIILFVQDQRSKEYFSHLLPDLGITTVSIATFIEWALKVLDLPAQAGETEISAVDSFSSDLSYEQEKIRIVRETLISPVIPKFSRSYLSQLEKIYTKSFSKEHTELFKQQKKFAVLDRIDLTLILSLYKNEHKNFAITKRSLVPGEKGKLIEKKKREVLDYMLMVVDEFQNYLPEQLTILNSCINKDYRSIVYVGDIGQQINPGAIRDWSEIGEIIPNERKILLDKVYRNTKKILSFIQSLGYVVNIPESIKEGTDVIKKKLNSQSEVVEYIQNLVKNRKERESIGILGINESDLKEIKAVIETDEFVHVLNARHSQGLEFDTVCILGFDEGIKFGSEIGDEKEKIQKDLLYIALTRAISDLHLIMKI